MSYPATYQAVLDSFDVLHTVDAGAQVESFLCGTDFDAKPLGIEFSPWLNGVAYSGNPVKMGSWMWGSEPAWFIYFHELGHNFSLAADRFQKLYPGGGYVSAGGDDWHFGTDFVEAWASMVGLYAAHELYTNPQAYGVTEAAVQNLKGQSASTQSGFLDALHNYEIFRTTVTSIPMLSTGYSSRLRIRLATMSYHAGTRCCSRPTRHGPD